MADDLTLIAGQPGNLRSISGWTDVRVTRGIERFPSDFDVAFTELYPGQADAVIVQPGDICQVKLGEDLVITGYVDDFITGYHAASHEVRVVGRGKCADLVDCAVLWPSGQITNSTALTIAKKLAEPYGVSVASDITGGRVIPGIVLGIGERVYEVLEQICRYEALLIYDLPDGNLFLSRSSDRKAASGFAEGKNVQSASVHRSMAQRFSEYMVYLNSAQLFNDLGPMRPKFVQKDPDVPRLRVRKTVIENGDADGHVSAQRAVWDAARRKGRGNALALRTDSWRDASGKLWEPNTLVSVDLPGLKMPQATLLIGEVTYIRSKDDGTIADLVLMPPDAFKPQPILLDPTFKEFASK